MVEKGKILVSGCLLGEKVRYDGDSGTLNGRLYSFLFEKFDVVSICPECEGGLPVPRTPAEIVGEGGFAVLDGEAKVLTRDGEDVTAAFIIGAEKVLEKALESEIVCALLKERSPSCGGSKIYDGSFAGFVIPGCGVTAALLSKNGIKVFSEELEEELLSWLDNPCW